MGIWTMHVMREYLYELQHQHLYSQASSTLCTGMNIIYETAARGYLVSQK